MKHCLLFLFLTGCSYFIPHPHLPTEEVCIPIQSTPPCRMLSHPDPSLSELIDLALSNHPKIKQAWAIAKQQAATLGEARGSYLPDVRIYVDAEQDYRPKSATYDFDCAISYLLYDFGERDAIIIEATRSLCAAQCAYQWESQTVVFNVIQNYYQCLQGVDLFTVQRSTIEDLKKIVTATVALVEGGVKTLADQLQAQTNLDQALIVLREIEGSLEKQKINLTAAIGLSKNIPLALGGLPQNIQRNAAQIRAEEFVQNALTHRFDVQATKYRILQQQASLQAAKSHALPHLEGKGTFGHTWKDLEDDISTVLLEIKAEIPFFQGFKDVNKIKKAKAVWEEAQTELDQKTLEVFAWIFQDYINLLQEENIITLSEKTVYYAQANYDLIFAGYTSGLYTILDLITAQNTLDQARKKLINAQASWFLYLAQLAYDSGSIKCH